MLELRKLLTLCLVLVCSIPAYGQFYRGIQGISHYNDKLEQIEEHIHLDPAHAQKLILDLNNVARKNDNNHLLTVLEIYQGTINYYNGLTDSALIHFDHAIAQAEQLKIQPLLSTAKIRKLLILMERNNIEPILSLMKDEYKIAKTEKDTINMIYALNGQALCHVELDDKKSCINLYIQAMDLAKRSHNDYEYGFLLNNLGLLKLQLNSPEEAIEDFRKGIKIAKKLNNVRLELTLLENVGYYYQMVDSIQKSEEIFTMNLAIASKRKFKNLAFYSLVNLGSLQYNLGNIQRGDSIMDVAVRQAKRDKIYQTLSPIYLNIAQFALEMGNYPLARQSIDSAMSYAKYNSISTTKESALWLNYQMYEKQGNTERALSYFKRYTEFRDSIDRNGHMAMITELQLKYDLERKQKEHEKVMREYDSNSTRYRRNIWITFVILFILIALRVLYYFVSKSKREAAFSEELVNRLEEEKGRIARDLHDGIGQSLVILKNKMHKIDTKDQLTIQQMDEAFDETIEEVRSISRSLIPPELRRLGLRKAIAKMLKDIEESTNILTTADTEALEVLDIDEKSNIRIYRIIQELTNNSIKHAQATSIRIVFQYKLGVLVMTYQDNGIGINKAESMDQNSVGLKSINQRLKYLNGTIKIDKKSKGFKAVIKIRLNQ